MIVAAPRFVSNVRIHLHLNISTLTDDAMVLTRETLETAVRLKNALIWQFGELDSYAPFSRVRTRRVLETAEDERQPEHVTADDFTWAQTLLG